MLPIKKTIIISFSVLTVICLSIYATVLQATPSKNNNASMMLASRESTTAKVAIPLTKVYKNTAFKYTIDYPADWTYKVEKKGGVTFKGNANTLSAKTSFLIQLMRQPLKHQTTQEIMDVLKYVLIKNTTNLTVIEEGEIPTAVNGSDFTARYVIYQFKIYNQTIGQLEVVLTSTKSDSIYVLDYITAADQFAADLPTAKAMVVSFGVLR